MALLIATTLTCVVLASCGQTSHSALNARKVADAIAASSLAQRGQRPAVTCPSGVKLAAGVHFYCVAQIGAQITPFLVTPTSGGGVKYRGVPVSQVKLLDLAQVAVAITRTLRTANIDPTSVSCPPEMPVQRGLEFVCVANVSRTRRREYLVSETNTLGRVSFRPL